ncbi:nuclear transport factor 2 family protein [Streptomyces bambusae]|uniref:nuclear transport factor 2 family protein n=1 Tax=Streptomyces bambusae TaxID=1550616 RepID=UPI001CFF7F96|nr:nuclear transport factor 2 family protein [Streptomyces bambusae]MCB5169609.1 nuclear transport factor 2 family protein [Streptomyces bambusae]
MSTVADTAAPAQGAEAVQIDPDFPATAAFPGAPAAVADLDALASEVRRLSDLAMLGRLVDRYLASLDQGSFDDAWAMSLFTEGVELTFPVGSHRGIAGVPAFTAEIMARWGRTHHHGSDVSVDLDGDRAAISWSLIASHIHFGSPLPPDASEYFQLGGRFTGVARRTPEGWRIDRLRLRIVWSTGAVPRGVTQVDTKTLDTRGN